MTEEEDAIAAAIPPRCELCEELPVAGRNGVWLCQRHFLEALELMTLGGQVEWKNGKRGN